MVARVPWEDEERFESYIFYQWVGKPITKECDKASFLSFNNSRKFDFVRNFCYNFYRK